MKLLLIIPRYLILALWLLLPLAAHATFAYVGSAQNASNGNTITYSPVAGNYLILVSNTSSGGGTPTITVTTNGTGGSVWTNEKNAAQDGGTGYKSLAICPTAPTGATTITVTFNGGTPGNTAMAVMELSGLSSTGWQGISTFNAQVAPGTGTNAIVSNSFSVTTQPAALIGWINNESGDGVNTAGSSPIAFTKRVNGTVNMLETARVTATGSAIANATTTGAGADTFTSYVMAISEPSGSVAPTNGGFVISDLLLRIPAANDPRMAMDRLILPYQKAA